MTKKVLLIGLNYHSYTVEIVRALREQGHEVHFHDIQPAKPWLKVLRRIESPRYGAALDRYHATILAAERGWRADLVLFIQVHQMSQQNLITLRRDQPSAEFVLYNWDAVSNHDYRPWLHHFNRVYTFDPSDAKTLGLHYLPLFCTPAFQNLQRRDATGHSVYTVGNVANPKRYDAVQAFKRYCREHDLEFKYFLAVSNNIFLTLMRNGHFPLDVSWQEISRPAFIDMMETSSAVFDFANHQQVGYTMRTIENLCAGKKIITNNAAIRNEPFYSADRIHVFEDFDFSGVKAFLARPLHNPGATFPEFHLSSFVRQLVGDR